MIAIPVQYETLTDTEYLEIWLQVLQRDDATGKNGRTYDDSMILLGSKHKGQWWKWENGFGHLTLDMKNSLRQFAQIEELSGIDPDIIRQAIGYAPPPSTTLMFVDEKECAAIQSTLKGGNTFVSTRNRQSLSSKRLYRPRLMGTERAKRDAAWFREKKGMDLEAVLDFAKAQLEGEKMSENREDWLNGWIRNGSIVTHPEVSIDFCAGCGRRINIACIVIPEDFAFLKDPDFPFEFDTCPLCEMEHRNISVEDLKNVPLSLIRQAISLRKLKGKSHEIRWKHIE